MTKKIREIDMDLIKAVKENNYDLVKELIDNGADVNATPKVEAPYFGGTAVTRIILYNRQETPLQLAAQAGNVEIIKLLIEKGADINANYGDCDSIDVSWGVGKNTSYSIKVLPTPLYYAVKSGHLEAMKLLIDAGADIDFPNISTRKYLAAKKGDPEAIVELLNKKAYKIVLSFSDDLEKRIADIEENDVEAINWMNTLQKKIKKARSGDIDTIKYVLSEGVNIDFEKIVKHTESPLHCAAGALNVKAIELLLNKGADVDPKGSQGTPLGHLLNEYYYTAEERKDLAEAVCIFLQYGADIKYIDIKSWQNSECSKVTTLLKAANIVDEIFITSNSMLFQKSEDLNLLCNREQEGLRDRIKNKMSKFHSTKDLQSAIQILHSNLSDLHEESLNVIKELFHDVLNDLCASQAPVLSLFSISAGNVSSNRVCEAEISKEIIDKWKSLPTALQGNFEDGNNNGEPELLGEVALEG